MRSTEYQVVTLMRAIYQHVRAWHAMSGVSFYTAVGGLLVFAFVVLPAVWSPRPDRREAALNVLDRLLRRR
jgi:hypothetical protein